MRYAEIKHNDIANGSGVCVSYWTQGCSHRCKGCHNPQTWNPNAGKEGTLVGVIDEILKAISANGITRNFSILGGEPLDSYNVGNVQTIIDEVRNAYPDVKIYLWTGYTLENLTEAQLNAIKNIPQIKKNSSSKTNILIVFLLNFNTIIANIIFIINKP